MIDLLSLLPPSEPAPPVSLGSSVAPTQDFSVQFNDLLQSLFAGIGDEHTSAGLSISDSTKPPELAGNMTPAPSVAPKVDEQVLLPPGEGPCETQPRFLGIQPGVSADIPSAEISSESVSSVDQTRSEEQAKPIETDGRTPDVHRHVRRPLPKTDVDPPAEPSDQGETPETATAPSVAIVPPLERAPRPDEIAAESNTRKPAKVQQPTEPKEKPELEDLIVKASRKLIPPLPFATFQVRSDIPQPVRVLEEPVAASLPKALSGFEQATSAPAPPNAAATLQASVLPAAKATPEVDIPPPAGPVIAPHPLDVAATVGLAAEIQQAVLEDVKKFEIDIRHEPPRVLEVRTPEPAPAMITTDPIANLRLLQLPPRVIPIQKVIMDAKSADRPKTDQGTTAGSDAATPVAMPQAVESNHAVATIDQSLPAQPIEIPDIPKLKLVRTVSMEVGEAESQVSIRIEERGGDMKLHLGVGNETLHRELESSMGSLIHTLKQEDIQISGAEVFKKSPVEKVRRMKEAKNGHR